MYTPLENHSISLHGLKIKYLRGFCSPVNSGVWWRGGRRKKEGGWGKKKEEEA